MKFGVKTLLATVFMVSLVMACIVWVRQPVEIIRRVNSLDGYAEHTYRSQVAEVLGLRRFAQTSVISVQSNAFSDDDLRAACDVPDLHHLRVMSDGITDEGTKQIAQCNKLRTLSLKSKNIDGSGLEWLGAASSIRKLDVSGDALTGHFLKIGDLPRLSRLSLSSPKIGDEIADALMELPSLEELYLPRTNISGGTLDVIGERLPQLQYVEVSYTRVTESDVSRFRAQRPDVVIINKKPL